MKRTAIALTIIFVLACLLLAGETAKKKGPDAAKLLEKLASSDEAAWKSAADALVKADKSEKPLREKLASAPDALAERIFDVLEKKKVLIFHAESRFLNLAEGQRGRYYFWKLRTGTKEEKLDCLCYFWRWERASDKLFEPVLALTKSVDIKTRRQAFRVLVLLKNPKAMPAFQAALLLKEAEKKNKTAVSLACEAAYGLGALGSKKALEILRNACEKDLPAAVKSKTYLALGRVDGAASAAVLRNGLKHPKARVRAFVLLGIIDSGCSTLSKVVRPLLGDNDSYVRAFSALAIAELGGGKYLADIQAQAKKETGGKNAVCRDAMKIAAFRLGGTVPASEIKKLLKIKYFPIHMAAAKALLETGDISGIGLFIGKIRNETIASQYVRTLRAFIPEIPGLPEHALHDAEQAARQRIIRWLGKRSGNLKWNKEKKQYDVAVGK